MLGKRVFLALVLTAASLSASRSSLAQSVGGFAHELDEAEKKLDADIKACRPIDESEYRRLMDQSSANFYTAEHAAKSGLPVDFKQIADDGERATRLFERAHAAANKPCPPPNQAHTTAKPPANPPPPPPPQPPSTPQAGAVEHPGPPPPPPPKDPFKQLENDAEDALDELDEAMDRCDEAWVKSLIPELEDISRQAHAAADAARAAGQFSLVKPGEAAAMARDLDEAIADAKKFKCPVKPFRSYRVVPISLSPVDERIVSIHNLEREAVRAPPLKWNFKLEWDATGYANELARTRQLVHAPREGRGIERENLLQALPGWSPDRMMQSWTMEKREFMPGYFPNVARDGDWMSVAHYTQMIWPTTLYIGCGYAEGGGYGWLVCRYSPGGNKDGKAVGLGPAIAGGASPTAPPQPARNDCWVDVKTGKAVNSVPSGTDMGDQGDAVRSGRTYNPRSGRNFAREPDGTWIDVKTGRPVNSVPSGTDIAYQGDAVRSGRTYNPRTARNFARIPCPAPRTSAPERG